MADSPRFEIVHGQRPEDVTGEMAERVTEVVLEYAGRITLPAAVGVLHIVAHELMEDHHG